MKALFSLFFLPGKKNQDWLKIFLVAFFLLGIFVFLVKSQNELGLSWDEAFYYHPSIKTIEWVQHVFTAQISEIIDVDQYFGQIPELPPLGKVVIGFSYRIGPFLGFHPLLALRWLNYFFFLTQLALAAFYLRRYLAPYNRAWWIAPLIFAGFPRILGHAHFATVDLLSSLFILLSTIFFLEYLKKGEKWYWLFFVFSLLGVVIKFNNLVHFCILFTILVLWEKKLFARKFLLTIFLFPTGIYFLWPWLWNAPFSKFFWFWNYFFHHAHTSVLYAGTHYAFTRAPWHYPFVMFIITTPFLHLFFLFSGLVPLVFYLRKKVFFKKSLLPFYLTGMSALYPLLLFLAPNAPTYDGVRLFIPAFPFISITLGLILGWWGHYLNKLFHLRSNFLFISIFCLFLFQFIYIAGTWKPYFLSYYNQITGGLKGAHNRFEVTYWCEPFNREVLDYLNEQVKPGETVRFLAFQGLIPQIYQEWGYLKPIDFTSEPPYDYHILYNRQGFFGSMEHHLFKNELPVKVFSFREVPFIMIYQTGGKY